MTVSAAAADACGHTREADMLPNPPLVHGADERFVRKDHSRHAYRAVHGNFPLVIGSSRETV